MIDRVKVMFILNEMYAKKLKIMGFVPNKGMNIYKYKVDEGEFEFRFIFNKKNSLHITFSYTDIYLGKKMVEVEEVIIERKKLSLPIVKNKNKYRACISITDWLHMFINNGFNPSDYEKWLFRINSLDELENTRSTYEKIFILVESHIISKIKDKESLYDYLWNEKYKYSIDYQFLLLLSRVIDNKNIKNEYHQIQSSKRYTNMVAGARNDIDLTFDILSNNEFLLP